MFFSFSLLANNHVSFQCQVKDIDDNLHDIYSLNNSRVINKQRHVRKIPK